MIDGEHCTVCPCCMCVHIRHAPNPRPRIGDSVMVLQALAMAAGLVYLLLFEAPDLITVLAQS
ncbi:MAG: hypothetical protein KJS95_13290 [Gammaproteobacteria bacterium]|nr:hypothetical protein [Gammaproteobacteria bacterium]